MAFAILVYLFVIAAELTVLVIIILFCCSKIQFIYYIVYFSSDQISCTTIDLYYSNECEFEQNRQQKLQLEIYWHEFPL